MDILGGNGDLILTGPGSGRPGTYTAVPVMTPTRSEPPISISTEIPKTALQ